MGEEFLSRIKELYKRSSSRGIAVYTEFLNPVEQDEVISLCGEDAEFFGGADFAERKIARIGFATKNSENPPISLLIAAQSSEKFAKSLTHRDYLGAILNLGIERKKIGDIFVGSACAYIVADEKIAEFLVENLTRVGSATVKTEYAESIPEEFAPKTEEKTLIVSSDRTDCLVGRAYNLSREKSAELCREKKVFSNGIAVAGDKR
ncbi:MAG: hypothetical protein IJS67_04815, partial [Clostridia bacterium]|nr:hypothetical protein [Clostridia bacterium]